jgi:hypothetical protein
MRKNRIFMAEMLALLLTFGLVLAGCPMDNDDPPDGSGFTSKTDNSTANTEAVLGFVGTSAASSDDSVATAAIGTGDNAGKIVITSKKAGTAAVTVSAADFTNATIAVTVAADGAATIGDITKGVSTGSDPDKYTVTFDTAGGSAAPAPIKVDKDGTIDLPSAWQ